jgi:hypothetical protein
METMVKHSQHATDSAHWETAAGQDDSTIQQHASTSCVSETYSNFFYTLMYKK